MKKLVLNKNAFFRIQKAPKTLINNKITKNIFDFFGRNRKTIFCENEILYINVNCRKTGKFNFFRKSIYINVLIKMGNFFLKLSIDF